MSQAQRTSIQMQRDELRRLDPSSDEASTLRKQIVTQMQQMVDGRQMKPKTKRSDKLAFRR